MSQPNNQVLLVGKKKKKKPLTTHPFWSQKPNSSTANRQNLVQPSISLLPSVSTQARSLIELVDDKSPNTPSGTADTKVVYANPITIQQTKRWLKAKMAKNRLKFMQNQADTAKGNPDNSGAAETAIPNQIMLSNDSVPQANAATANTVNANVVPGTSATPTMTPTVLPTVTPALTAIVTPTATPMLTPTATPLLATTDPPILQPAAATQKPQPSNIYYIQPTRKRGSSLDIYAYNYPKGIPKSFLIQQQRSQEPGNQGTMAPDSPMWPMPTPTNNIYQPSMATFNQIPASDTNPGTAPIFVQTDNQVDVQQPYSPSDIYADTGNNPELCEDEESSDLGQGAQKRLSAFHRLGPLTQPKKPKLTINLTLNKEQPVREVVNATDDDPDRYTPVHLRQDIIKSTDETVMKFLTCWPWRKNVGIRRSATARNSRSVMILEQEQMEEAYDKENLFIQISVKGYPSTWTKERVLDAILESVKGYRLIPCFIEFYQHECKFLTMRSRSALIILHKTGFYIHKDGVELTITISQTDLTLNQIDFIPRIILRKRVALGYDGVNKLNLSAFTLQDDISHFIYFPLSRLSNQSELIQIQTVTAWENLAYLDLSHNNLTNISGFDLNVITPKLKHLNLSHNRLEKLTLLIGYRDLPLKSIHLEGNPLCHDYTDPEHYVKVLKMMFPAIVEIDGVPLHLKGQLPHFQQNYCPENAKEVTEKFLEIFFPLLDSGAEQRSLIQGMYDDDATLTVTYCYKLRYGPIYRCFRNLFLYARFLDEGETDSVVGAMAITKLINRWPQTNHDPYTFTVDVMLHTETTTILRINGVLKLTVDTLADDEHLLTFTRTVVLYSEDGAEYKIQNEMLYWDEPTAECARSAFRVTSASQRKINLKIESTTDEDLKEKLLIIFMKLTAMDKKICERCLEINSWNFKLALEHFTKLLKSNNLDSLSQEVLTDNTVIV